MAFLELEGVSKGYSTATGAVAVLTNVNLSMDRGEFVAILGCSGVGKTTLVSLIAALIHPDVGSIRINGNGVTEPGRDRGVVFQNYSLLPWLSVFENVFLAVDQCFPSWTVHQKRQHTRQYVEIVNLTPAADKRPHELSGGMRQRVAVARALAMNPEVLLLDEPLSALDALTRATLQDEISRIWQQDQKTVLLITNDVDEAILLADRVIALSAGPGATLGLSVTIDIPRPRRRKELNHIPAYQEARRLIFAYLVRQREQRRDTATTIRTLPDVEPEDLTLVNPLNFWFLRRGPMRRTSVPPQAAR